jgi:hypothetical protein
MQALEVTTFKLRPGLTVADFIAANTDVDAWLLKQPGFVSRRIAERDDGAVIDALVWTSVEAGEDGAARLMVELAASPVHAAIDQTTVEWTVSPIRHAVDGFHSPNPGTVMTNTPLLAQAADRFAVIEALSRFATGIDRRDWDLFASSISETVVSDFGPASAKAGIDYPVIEGRENLIAALAGSLSPFDTTHSVANPLVTIDGDTARLDALVEAQHVLISDPSRHYLMKNRYDVELVREGDVWVITRNTVDNVWRSGDVGVMAGV